MRWIYYKLRQVLQIAMIITNYDSTAPLQFKVHAHVQRNGESRISELTHDVLGRNRRKGGHEEFTELLLKSFYQHIRYDLTILHILYIYYTLIL